MSATRLKLVIAGDLEVEKTELLFSYINGEFPEWYCPTPLQNYVADLMCGGKLVQLALWDTSKHAGGLRQTENTLLPLYRCVPPLFLYSFAYIIRECDKKGITRGGHSNWSCTHNCDRMQSK